MLREPCGPNNAKLSTRELARPAKYYGVFGVLCAKQRYLNSANCDLDNAPTLLSPAFPPLNMISVGMPDMNFPGTSGLASTSTLQTLTLPAYSLAISSWERSFAYCTIPPKDRQVRGYRWTTPLWGNSRRLRAGYQRSCWLRVQVRVSPDKGKNVQTR